MTERPIVKRVLENKTQLPEYKKRDIEPPTGGRSLLHDEHGIPKVSPYSKSKGDIPIMNSISNDPVPVMASDPENNKHVFYGNHRRGVPAIPENEDKFFPPKSNFVNVGAVDQSWHSEAVTGIPDQPMVDNNDEVNTESLQGSFHNDLEDDVLSKLKSEWTERMQLVRSNVIAELSRINTYDEYKNLKNKVFNKGGVFTKIANQFSKINPDQKPIIGSIINDLVESLMMEFQTVESEFDDEADESEVHEEPIQSDSVKSFSMQEGQYCIIVSGKPFSVVDSKKDAQEVISKLLLSNNIDLAEVELITRVRIDFGVLIGD